MEICNTYINASFLSRINKFETKRQCTVHSALCTVYSAQCTVHIVQCTVYSAQLPVHSVQCTVHIVQ